MVLQNFNRFKKVLDSGAKAYIPKYTLQNQKFKRIALLIVFGIILVGQMISLECPKQSLRESSS